MLEPLEDRTLLSAAVATTTDGLVNDIVAANNGTGPTTIQLRAADATNGFEFASAYNSTNNALPQITANITIEGTSGFNNIIQRNMVSGTPAFRLFDVAGSGSLTLEDLTLQGGLAHGTGTAAEGGAIYNSGTLSLSGVVVQSNKAQGSNSAIQTSTKRLPAGSVASGGGLYVAAGTVTLSNDMFISNSAVGGNGQGKSVGSKAGGTGGAGSGGGLYVDSGAATLSNVQFTANSAVGGHGGRGAGSTPSGHGGHGGHGGAASGGGLYLAGGGLTVSWNGVTTLNKNEARGGHAALGSIRYSFGTYATGIGGKGGTASGGGLYVAKGTVSLNGNGSTLNVSDNQARGGSGGKAGTFGDNGGSGGAGYGGGLYVGAGGFILNSATFTSNTARGGDGGNGGAGRQGTTSSPRGGNGGNGGNGGAASGGGLYMAGSSITLSNAAFNSNSAAGGRGGYGGSGGFATDLAAEGAGGNGGNGGAATGGGLYVAGGTVALNGSTFSTNSVKGGNGGFAGSSGGLGGGAGGKATGGGLYLAEGAVTLINDTLSGNTAKGGRGGSAVSINSSYRGAGGNGGDASGGGLYILSASTTNLANTLIAENTVTAGTGGTGKGGSAPAGSASGADVSGTVASSDHDLIGNSSGFSATTSTGDILDPSFVGLDPNGLQNNGGHTQTIALVSTSPAIDKGESNAAPAATDQRGYARIVGSAIDIGAYEFGATAATTDLSVSGNAPSSVAYGGQITYTLTVTNNSSTTAQSNVTLADLLPANTTLLSWTAPSSWNHSAPAAGSSSGTATAWTVSLAAGATAGFTLVVQLDSSAAVGTPISNSASVGPITGDPTPNNNSTSFQTAVVQATPTVTVNPVNITYGTALANSQLSGTATATFDGNTVTVAGTFTYTSAAGTVLDAGNSQSEAVTFTPSDSTNYATVYTTLIVNVAPATLTITPDTGQSKVYGAVVPTLTYQASGFVNGDPASLLTGALGTTATAASPVGNYAFTTGTLSAGSNYTVVLAARSPTFAVTPAPLTVTANDATMIEGGALPTFTASYSGFVLNEGPSVLGGKLTFSTTATSSSPPGAYPITPSGLTSGNYDITFVSGTLTILSYSQATTELQTQVDAAGLDHGIQNSLDSQLQAAFASFNVGDTTAGVNQLNAFIHHVIAQSGKHIPVALTDAWIAYAKRIINVVG